MYKTLIVIILDKVFLETHGCPSGLRGMTQDHMAKASWVRTPPRADYFFYSFNAPLAQLVRACGC